MITSEELLSKVDALPALPGTAMRLMATINDPQSTVDDIVAAIRYDQALTAEVLRLCNSAYFGHSRRVTSLNEAMIRLGTVKVLQLVMAVHTTTLLSNEQPGYGLEAGLLWRHSVATALASSIVGKRLKIDNLNLAFTAGLLHDIGKVVLSRYVQEVFQEICRLVEGGTDFVEAERNLLGFSHEEIGAMVAERWKLPSPIVECLRYHHEPWRLEPRRPLVDTIYLANVVCQLLGIGIGEDGLCYRADPALMDHHGLVERDLEMIGVQTLQDLQTVEMLFAAPAAAGV